MASPSPKGAALGARPRSVTSDPVLDRLVQRITMGPRPADYEWAEKLGYDEFLEYHLDHLNIPEAPEIAQITTRWPTTFMTSGQLWAWSDVTVNANESESTIWRAIHSNRGLFERMVEFWRDHFSIFSGKPGVWNFLPPDFENVIRANALGTYPQMLAASSKSPAMLWFLDNQLSTAAAPNENYARELLELHSMGVDQGYTQQDVMEAARCLTGWRVQNFGSQPQSGTFLFDASIHDNGPKTVLGQTIPAGGGVTDGETLVQIIAQRDETARFLAKKLVRRFLGEGNFPEAEEDTMKAFVISGGDIKETLRMVLRYDFVANAAPRFKRPFHLFCSALRTLPLTFSPYSLYNLRARFDGAGHGPFQWGQPNGAPDRDDAWSGNMISRWNFFGELLAGVIWDTSVNLGTFFAGTTDAVSTADRIDAMVFSNRMDPLDKADVLAYLQQGTLTATRKQESLVLAFSSPGFSRY